MRPYVFFGLAVLALIPACNDLNFLQAFGDDSPSIEVQITNNTAVTVRGDLIYTEPGIIEGKKLAIGAGDTHYYEFGCEEFLDFSVWAEFYEDPLQGGPTAQSATYELNSDYECGDSIAIVLLDNGHEYRILVDIAKGTSLAD